MEKLLFIDACISTHESRTKRLCDVYIKAFNAAHSGVEVESVVLRKGIVEPLTKERIIERDQYVRNKDWNHSMFSFARQIKEADFVVVGTPYWDLSFASILKVYIENIMVADLTFEATNDGFIGLCKGKKLTYITTAGGFIGDNNFGYDYMRGVSNMLGIKKTEFFSAEALDIEGMDPNKIMKDAEEIINASFGK